MGRAAGRGGRFLSWREVAGRGGFAARGARLVPLLVLEGGGRGAGGGGQVGRRPLPPVCRAAVLAGAVLAVELAAAGLVLVADVHHQITVGLVAAVRFLNTNPGISREKSAKTLCFSKIFFIKIKIQVKSIIRNYLRRNKSY